MRLVVCSIAGAVLCGSFFIALWLIEPEAPPHHDDLPTATQNAGLARNREQQRRYDDIDEILAQRQPTRTPKDSEAERQRFRAEAQQRAADKILAKKHHPDQIEALLRKM